MSVDVATRRVVVTSDERADREHGQDQKHDDRGDDSAELEVPAPLVPPGPPGCAAIRTQGRAMTRPSVPGTDQCGDLRLLVQGVDDVELRAGTVAATGVRPASPPAHSTSTSGRFVMRTARAC